MSIALELAQEAFINGEVPVGCVIADADANIIGTGRNRMEKNRDATCHAELEAIKAASENRGDWRLDDCTLFVNLEPCPMCAGAIINARIPNVVFASRDDVRGACGGVIDLFSENFHHKVAVYPGVMNDESSALLKRFFADKRKDAL